MTVATRRMSSKRMVRRSALFSGKNRRVMCGIKGVGVQRIYAGRALCCDGADVLCVNVCDGSGAGMMAVVAEVQ